MVLSIFFAQLCDDGMGAGDALMVAGDFRKAVENLFAESWKDQGKAVFAALKTKKSSTLQEILPAWPDCHRHAEQFAEFVEQFAEHVTKGYS